MLLFPVSFFYMFHPTITQMSRRMLTLIFLPSPKDPRKTLDSSGELHAAARFLIVATSDHLMS
jgi:hypothetical protein